MTTSAFRKLIREFYKENRRDLPWRNTTNPYYIVVSEIMLQQTQVSRVLVKYEEFLMRFPTWRKLADAQTKDILKTWSGMGYNRRALYLKKIAEEVSGTYKGNLPKNYNKIIIFPGIGKATAGSILAFAFNKPNVFIETNVRRVYLHHFFKDKKNVSDDEIFPVVEKTLDRKNPREWYYALMDYGSYLAKQIENPNKRSKHYSLQSKFKGSNREIRGALLKILLKNKSVPEEKIFEHMSFSKKKIDINLTALLSEGFIERKNGAYRVK